jgi:hypothetical protein
MSATTPLIGAEDSSIFSSTLRGRGRRIFATLVAIVLGVALLGEISKQTRGARGPSSSSYATSSGGLAALVSLLNGNGVKTARITTSIDRAVTDGTLGQEDLLVVVDQDLSDDERTAIYSFIDDGGSLVGGGRASLPWLSDTLGLSSEDALRSGPGTDGAIAARVDGSDQEFTLTTGRVAPVVFAPSAGEARPTGVDENGAPAILTLGSIVAVADSTIFANAQLAKQDNAAFALALLQPTNGSRVVFAEAGHGFRSDRGAGLAAIPSPVRMMLLGFVLAAIAWMFAVGRRVGAPDLANRPLAPSRFEHVEAVASLAERARRPSTTPTDDSPPPVDTQGM